MGCSRKQTQVTPLSLQVLVATVTQQGIPAGQKPVATHNGFRSANINAQVQGYLIALCDSAAVLFGKT
jgi:hypothetical protein